MCNNGNVNNVFNVLSSGTKKVLNKVVSVNCFWGAPGVLTKI